MGYDGKIQLLDPAVEETRIRRHHDRFESLTTALDEPQDG